MTSFHFFRPIAACVFSATAATAQDGGQLYATYCAACHADDGKGATGGQFPPLAGSPWVKGTADRMIMTVLHGITGPVEVLGKTYNLEMPPQGAVLADDAIAAIATYIRSSWGNQETQVTPEQVKALREKHAARDKPWTAPELLKLHPLPLEQTALRDIVSRTYLGVWQNLPDFSKLEPINVEEEHDGLIRIEDAAVKPDAREHFAIVWEGDFEAPATGQYTFRLDADDSARVLIDGKPVATVPGVGPMNGGRANEGKVRLEKGLNPIRIEYVEYTGQEGIALGWKGPGVRQWRWLTDATASPKNPWPSIPIRPAENRTAIYRNFIAGTTPRAIGFGFPGGVNLAWSADHFAPELVWTGAFMDGGHHWTDRGVGNEPPAGDSVVKLSASKALPDGARFRGYQLDPAGNPTFSTQVGNQIVLDAWQSSENTLVRKLTLNGGTTPVDLLIAEKTEISSKKDGVYQIGGTLLLSGAALTVDGDRLTLKLSPGKPVTLSYGWGE